MSTYLWDFGSGDPWLDDADNGFAGTQLDSQPTQPATTLDEEVWRETLRKLAKGFEISKWEIGDHILKAEGHFPDWPSERLYGHTIPASGVYAEAERETGLSRALLYDLASTAKRCPSSVRTEKLSWTHHRILVNTLKPEGDEAQLMNWLKRAAEEGWTTRQLKKAVTRGYRGPILEKKFQVKVPIAVWETLKTFADLKRVTVQKVAAQWLVEKSEESQIDRSIAAKTVSDRRKAKRRRVGQRVARDYNSLRLDYS
jgi:hypothetical protein